MQEAHRRGCVFLLWLTYFLEPVLLNLSVAAATQLKPLCPDGHPPRIDEQIVLRVEAGFSLSKERTAWKKTSY